MKTAVFSGCLAWVVASLLHSGVAVAQSPVGASMADELTEVLARPQRCADFDLAPPSGVLRLDSVLRTVVCNHPGVRRGEGLSTQAQASLELANAQASPTVSASVGLNGNRGASAGQESALSLRWVLFDFGQRNAQSAQAGKALSAVLDEQRVEVLNAVGEAAMLYAAAQAAFGRLDAVTLNRHTAQDSLEAAEARHGVGASTLSEMLQAKTALAQARLDEARAMSQWQTARGELAVAMRLPANAKLILAPLQSNEPALAALNIEALTSEALAHHPRVGAARARLEQANAQAQSVRAERWGNVSLTASGGTGRPSYGAPVERTGSVQLAWSVPLFDGGARKARQGELQGSIQTSQTTLEVAAQQIELQVWQLSQALLSEADAHKNSRVVLESAEAALKVATERFKLGAGTFSDMLAAQNVAANARLQVVVSQANLYREQWRLAAAVGRFGSLLRF